MSADKACCVFILVHLLCSMSFAASVLFSDTQGIWHITSLLLGTGLNCSNSGKVGQLNKYECICVCVFLLISAPSLGVYYFLSLSLCVCPSVCLSQTLLLFCFSMESSHFFGHQFSMTKTKLFSSIFDLGSLTPKIYSPKFSSGSLSQS